MNIEVVRPLVDKYYECGDVSMGRSPLSFLPDPEDVYLAGKHMFREWANTAAQLSQ